MKIFIIMVFVLFICISFSGFGQNPEWVICTSGSRIYSLAEKGDYVSAGTAAGLVRINKLTGVKVSYDKFNSGLPNDNINSLTIENSGTNWIGTNGGLAKFDGTSWTVYKKSNSGLPNDTVTALATDNIGNTWIGTKNGGLAKYDGTTWIVYNDTNSGLPINRVTSIRLDNSGNKWIGTASGLAKYDGSTWTVYKSTNSGLPYNYVNSVAIDNSGNKWIGTGNGGLAKYDGTTWTVYNTTNSGIPSNGVNSVAVDPNGTGIKWLGTNGPGLTKYDGTTWTVYNTTNSGLPDNEVRSLTVENNGNKWVGTYGGLAVYREGGVILDTKDERNASTLKEFQLLQNYPNPFNPLTLIQFSIKNNANVLLKVYNTLGQEVATLVNEEKTAGNYEVSFNASGLSSGVYFYTIKAGGFTETKKLILLR